MSQMTVQAMWNTDSPLRQIPHFSAEILERCSKAQVEKVDDVLDLEDDERNRLLSTLDSRRMRDVAKFCNAYPSTLKLYSKRSAILTRHSRYCDDLRSRRCQ